MRHMHDIHFQFELSKNLQLREEIPHTENKESTM